MDYPVVDMKKTGKRIRELMKLKNIRTKDIVEYMGFESEQSVYKWLRGDSLPKVDNLLALSRLFGTPMDSIIMVHEGEDESPLLPRFWKKHTKNIQIAMIKYRIFDIINTKLNCFLKKERIIYDYNFTR